MAAPRRFTLVEDGPPRVVVSSFVVKGQPVFNVDALRLYNLGASDVVAELIAKIKLIEGKMHPPQVPIGSHVRFPFVMDIIGTAYPGKLFASFYSFIGREGVYLAGDFCSSNHEAKQLRSIAQERASKWSSACPNPRGRPSETVRLEELLP